MVPLLKITRFSAVAFGALLGMTTAGCGSSGTSAPGDSASTALVVAQSQEPTTLDPHAREDGGERIVNGNVYETLLDMDDDGELTPLLAEGLPEQVDETTWEIEVRTGITFHNGDELDATDVAASFERIIDPDFASEQSAQDGIMSAEAVSATTVRFQTEGPDPVFPRRLYWIKIVPSEYANESDFASQPIGTGPYEFITWDRGQAIELSANEEYWGDAGDVEGVTFEFVPEAGSRVAGLRNGEFDITTNLLPEDTERVPNFAHIPGLEQTLMVLDNDAGLTQDERVREALNYAVDKEALADSLYGGFATVQTCQILGEVTVGYNEALEPYAYDPERARALLEQAGAVGQELVVTGTAGRWLKDRELTEAVAEYWKQAGLTPVIEILDFDSYLEQLFADERPAALFLSETSELLDASQSMGSYYAMSAPGSSNSDAELQRLIDAAAVQTDPDERQQTYNQATDRACDSALFTYLLNIEDIYGLSDRVEDWQPRVDAQILVKDISLS